MLIEVANGPGAQGGFGKGHFQKQKSLLRMTVARAEFLRGGACQRAYAGGLIEGFKLQKPIFENLEGVGVRSPRNVRDSPD
jgi:hypothetical protein